MSGRALGSLAIAINGLIGMLAAAADKPWVTVASICVIPVVCWLATRKWQP